MKQYLSDNLANWNSRVPLHLSGDFYDIPGFLAGRTALKQIDLREMGPVDGRTLLHLQCHFGQDTLSWARRGALVTGLDFSAPAIDAARELADRAGLQAEFVCADAYDAPTALQGRTFDIVTTGVGALCWLPDIRRWAEVVARCLVPGGLLYVREGHPSLWSLDPAPGAPHDTGILHPYFETDTPITEVEDTTYGGGSEPLDNPTSHCWNHGLGEILTALFDAGLQLEMFHEHRVSDWQALPQMVKTDDGMWALPEAQRDLVPLMYSLRARKRG